MIQIWLGNENHTCKQDRPEYKTVIELAIEKKIDKEKLKGSWLNDHTNEFKLFDSGVIEIVDRQNTEKTYNRIIK